MTKREKTTYDTDWNFNSCFGCGPDNPIGLKLIFHKDGENTVGKFTPSELYQGWKGLVHGGIITCLLDEAMAYAARFETGNLTCVTARIEAKLKRPTSTGEPLLISAAVTRRTKKLLETRASISSQDGILIAEGKSTQFIVEGSNKNTQ